MSVGEEVVEEVDEEKKEIQNSAAAEKQQNRETVDRPGRPSAEAAARSTGPVDRRARRHAQVAVDRPSRSQDEIGRPGGRPTEVTQLSVGNGRPARSTGA